MNATLAAVTLQATPESAALTNVESNGPIATIFYPFIRNSLAGSLLLVTLATGVFFIALHWQRFQFTEGILNRAFHFLGYVLFLLGGVLIGLLAFPVLAPQYLIELPTLVGVVGALLLVAILAMREATAQLEGAWESVHSLLNVAIGLLLMGFFFIVSLRLAEFLM